MTGYGPAYRGIGKRCAAIRFPPGNPIGLPGPAAREPGPGVVVVEGARLIPFRVLAPGRRAMRQVARGCVGDYGAAWAAVGVLPVRAVTRSWRRLTPILPKIILRWSRTECTEMNSVVAMSS